MADRIPGINVGNLVKQIGSYVGAAPKADYDIFDNVTLSNRPGQFQVNTPLKPVAGGSKTVSGGSYQEPSSPQVEYNAGGSYSSGYGGGSTASTYNPQAAAQNSLLSSLGGNLDRIYGSSVEAAQNSGRDINAALRDWGFQQRQAQNAINSKAVQNEASRVQGTNDVLNMVGRGIQSGGRILANKNAGNSSAAGEIARAYGTIGQAQQSKIGNQYAAGQNEINQDQAALNEQQGIYAANFGDNKEKIVGSIVQSAQQQLAELDTALRGASLPDRIAIEDQKNKIRDAARGELAKFDSILADQRNSARALGGDEARAKALELQQAGAAPAGQFEYSTEAPLGFQGQDPAGGNLPLFTLPRNKDRTLGV